MTTSGDRHAPRAEFVAALEQEVRRAYREGAPTSLSASPAVARGALWRQRAKSAAVLAIGLVLGVGATMASAQVQDSRTRSEFEASVELERDVRAMRLRVAREAMQKAQQSFAAGAISKESLLAAEMEVKVSELAIAKLDVDLQEVAATSRAPRNELWAPTVNGRDYVLERLRLDAAASQEQLRVAEMQVARAKEHVASGAAGTRETMEMEHELMGVTRVFEMHALLVKLREEAVEKSLPRAEVFMRVQRMEREMTIRAFRQRVSLAEARYKVVVERVKAGLATKLEEKRAELALLESEEELEQAIKATQRFERPEGA